MDQKKFFKKFNISDKDFDEVNLEWSELEKIYNHYNDQLKSDDYEFIAQAISNKLNNIAETHSTKYRLKNPEHLIEKIIRKSINDKEVMINLENYQDEITDIIGVRVLHLFKEDWDNIHKYIENEFNLIESPIAYYRNGDSNEYLEHFKKNNCTTKKHEFGYRSVHYLAKSSLFKGQYKIEIQVRTIFEEGWSECLVLPLLNHFY